MKVNIYINDRPLESLSEEEAHDIRCILSIRSMKAAGYVPEEGSTLCTAENQQGEKKS